MIISTPLSSIKILKISFCSSVVHACNSFSKVSLLVAGAPFSVVSITGNPMVLYSSLVLWSELLALKLSLFLNPAKPLRYSISLCFFLFKLYSSKTSSSRLALNCLIIEVLNNLFIRSSYLS